LYLSNKITPAQAGAAGNYSAASKADCSCGVMGLRNWQHWHFDLSLQDRQTFAGSTTDEMSSSIVSIVFVMGLPSAHARRRTDTVAPVEKLGEYIIDLVLKKYLSYAIRLTDETAACVFPPEGAGRWGLT